MNLSRNHIVYTLGIPVSLNKSIQLNESLIVKILHEQLLYETFLDSIKNYASEKYDQVITTIKDWKDAAAVLGKVLSSNELLNDFLKPLQRRVEKSILPLTDFLKKLKLDSFVETIKKILTKINSLEGWKKFMGLVSIGSIITYILEKLKSSGPDAVKNILTNILSSDFVTDIGSKLIDFKSYLGWLQPIVKGVEIIFNFLKPLIDAFAQAFKSGSAFATKLIKENTMKKSELKQLIKEEITKILTEVAPAATNTVTNAAPIKQTAASTAYKKTAQTATALSTKATQVKSINDLPGVFETWFTSLGLKDKAGVNQASIIPKIKDTLTKMGIK